MASERGEMVKASAAARKKTFAENLARRTAEKGWSGSELARRASQFMPDGKKVGKDSVSIYMKGRSLPGPVALLALSRALGCEPDDLIPGAYVRDTSGEPPLEIRAAPNKPGHVVLRINQQVSLEKATRIMEILSDGES